MTTATVTITRPSNTTAYTAADVIGNADTVTAANAGNAVLAFGKLRDGNDDIIIHSASIRMSNATVPASMTTLVLHLFDAAPDAILDNAAFALSAGDRGKYLGAITFTPAVVTGGTMLYHAVNPDLQLGLANGQSSVWGELVTTAAHTPVSASTYTLTLNARTA